MPAPLPIDIPEFATRQLDLLEAELHAELSSTALITSTHAPIALQRAGLALLNLHVAAQRTGLGGRMMLDLAVDPALSNTADVLPEHGFRVGDICAVAEQPKGAERKSIREDMVKRGTEGVVTKIAKGSVTIALDRDDADVPAGRLWLTKLANHITHKRLKATMTQLQKAAPSALSTLTQVLFDIGSPTPSPLSDLSPPSGIPEKWYDASLNESQKSAIRFALASKEIALIHGPPGTGKTHTIIELILQLVSAPANKRILVCGPSNVSVDNIVERLARHRIPMLRLGHPARLLPSVLGHSLEVMTRTGDAAGIVADVRAELDAKQASVRKSKNGRERKATYADMKELRKEFREREGKVVGDLITSSRVVCATLHGSGGFQMKNQRFDVVIIDEASQALEAQCWIPILMSGAEKLVLAGDHLQLPPTIKSTGEKKGPASKEKKTNGRLKDKKAEKYSQEEEELNADSTNIAGAAVDSLSLSESHSQKNARKPLVVSLEMTLFDRLLLLHGPEIKRMLTTQYRMHEKIMAFPSKTLYENELVAADSVKTHLLKDLPYDILDTEDTREPLIFFDTQGDDFPEKADDDGAEDGLHVSKRSILADSKVNPGEALVVQAHIARLVEARVKPEDIAVVTPYNGQLALLGQMLKEKYLGLELGSVDGFQGREKEVVIVSLVRSNEEREVGFLAEKRRLNVAMTRPKRQLCVVGDSETISKGSKFLKAWMSFLEQEADLRYPDFSELASQRWE